MNLKSLESFVKLLDWVLGIKNVRVIYKKQKHNIIAENELSWPDKQIKFCYKFIGCTDISEINQSDTTNKEHFVSQLQNKSNTFFYCGLIYFDDTHQTWAQFMNRHLYFHDWRIEWNLSDLLPMNTTDFSSFSIMFCWRVCCTLIYSEMKILLTFTTLNNNFETGNTFKYSLIYVIIKL